MVVAASKFGLDARGLLIYGSAEVARDAKWKSTNTKKKYTNTQIQKHCARYTAHYTYTAAEAASRDEKVAKYRTIDHPAIATSMYLSVLDCHQRQLLAGWLVGPPSPCSFSLKPPLLADMSNIFWKFSIYFSFFFHSSLVIFISLHLFE